MKETRADRYLESMNLEGNESSSIKLGEIVNIISV